MVAVLMVLVALAFVLVPLLRQSRGASGGAAISQAGSNVAVLKAQKHEIEDDFAKGMLTAEERDAALAELSHRIVDEVPADEAAMRGPVASPNRPWLVIGILALAIPVASGVLYATWGASHVLRMDKVPVQAAGAADHGEAGDSPQMSDAKIVEMVDTLAKKMEQNPGDPKGWVLLARSQAALGRMPAALAAYERAAALLPKDAQILADYADTLVISQQGRFEGKPMEVIKRALVADPNHLKALALAGTAEMRFGNKDASIRHWEKIKSLLPKDSDDFRQVEAIIVEVRTGKPPEMVADAGGKSNPHAAGMPAAPAAPTAPPPASPGTPAAAAPAATGAKVTGQVSLAPDMASKLAPGDVLFILARAKSGPRMPLAVQRIAGPKAADFPKAFELTDAMAMAPGMSLSSFPEVVIEARISKTGNAQLQPGDLSGASEAVKPGAANVKVVVSNVVKAGP